jgi:hypothetical protein
VRLGKVFEVHQDAAVINFGRCSIFTVLEQNDANIKRETLLIR